MPFLGGYGVDFFGELYGAGGPISVMRAIAMAGQVVRVTFSEEPLHKSAAGVADALNPQNYALTVVSGQATAPGPTVVSKILAVGPTRGVLAGDERGVDVGVDRPLAAGITYRITVSNVKSALGGELGTPDSADFAGIVVPRQAIKPARRLTGVDLRNDVSTGALVVASGDLAPEESQIENYRKRVFRRLTTPKDAWAHLKGYGAGLAHMEPAAPAQVAQARRDATAQIKQEPETQDATVRITIDGTGVVTVLWSAVLKNGVQTGGTFKPTTTA